MEPIFLFQLAVGGFLLVWALFTGWVYWFSPSKNSDYRLVSERHDQPEAKRRIIVYPRQFEGESMDINLGLALSKQFNGELLFVDFLTENVSERDREYRIGQLEELCAETSSRSVDCGYLLAMTDSVIDGLNRIVNDGQAEVMITSWSKEASAEERINPGFLDALIDSCPVRLLLVEDKFALPLQDLLLATFGEESIPFLMGVSSSLGEPDHEMSVDVLHPSQKPGNNLKRERFSNHVREAVRGQGPIEDEWLRRNVSAEIKFVPAGGYIEEIVDRSQAVQGLMVELTGEKEETRSMFSDIISQSRCPLLLARPEIGQLELSLSPLFQVK